jgi:hypothetical protein
MLRYINKFVLFIVITSTSFPSLNAQTERVSKKNSTVYDSAIVLNKASNYKETAKIQKPGINPFKFGGLTSFTIGAGLYLHNFQKHAWWSGQREKFHIQNDWSYAMSMDKLGHLFIGGLINRTMKDAFIWSGMNNTTAIWTSSLFSIAYMTDIEIEDGFAKQWGYSPGDELFNILGDAYATGQDLWKPLNTVKIRWSYWPTHDPNHKGDFPDDYNGQTFWLSFSVYDYLPKNMKQYWPEYFNFALGYGVKQYDNYNSGGRIQNLYLSLDYDIRKIIPGRTTFLVWLKELIYNFKIIPAPALKYDLTSGKIKYVVHL